MDVVQLCPVDERLFWQYTGYIGVIQGLMAKKLETTVVSQNLPKLRMPQSLCASIAGAEARGVE